MKRSRPNPPGTAVSALLMKYIRLNLGVSALAILSTAYLLTSLHYIRTLTSSTESPYEQRHPGQKLPVWAKKKALSPPPDNNIPEVCLVHIGKTAGSTLACMLGYDYEGCEDAHPLTQSLLTHATRHLLKNMFNDCPDHTPYYLFATRNPVERIQSWFAYERPVDSNDKYYEQKKPLFVDCPFETLADLVERGLGQQSSSASGYTVPECHQRALDAIQGKVPYSRHNYYNYRYYLDQATKTATTRNVQQQWYVIRSEHLRDDLNSVEAHLHSTVLRSSGSPFQMGAVPQSNKSKYHAHDRKTLSPTAQQRLCQALCDEIQVYQLLLRRAINLTPAQVQESLQELRQTCPHEVALQQCDTLRTV